MDAPGGFTGEGSNCYKTNAVYIWIFAYIALTKRQTDSIIVALVRFYVALLRYLLINIIGHREGTLE